MVGKGRGWMDGGKEERVNRWWKKKEEKIVIERKMKERK